MAQEAVGRRRLNGDVRTKVTKFCEALLAGAIDLELAVELFGGIAPADHYATAGFEEAKGTWGKMTARPEIKQALSLVASMLRAVHVPLLDLNTTPALDFGLEALYRRAQHLQLDRLVVVLKEAFDSFSRAFEMYRDSLAADKPCLRDAIADAIVTVLVPLALEQQTVRAARAEAVSVLAAHGRDTTAKGQAAEISSLKRKLDFLEKEMGAGDLAHATSRPHGHATARRPATRPHDHMTTRPHDHTTT